MKHRVRTVLTVTLDIEKQADTEDEARLLAEMAGGELAEGLRKIIEAAGEKAGISMDNWYATAVDVEEEE